MIKLLYFEMDLKFNLMQMKFHDLYLAVCKNNINYIYNKYEQKRIIIPQEMRTPKGCLFYNNYRKEVEINEIN